MHFVNKCYSQVSCVLKLLLYSLYIFLHQILYPRIYNFAPTDLLNKGTLEAACW